MTKTVTVSEFRDNLSYYLDLLKKKVAISVTDGRKGMVLVNLVHRDEPGFDWDAHMKWIKNMKPFLTDGDLKDMKKFRKDINKRFEEARKR
jgi:hypothetical protein